MQIVFTLVVPGTIGFVIVASSFYQHERDNIAQNTIATVRALVSAVDRDLTSTTMAAQILATSPHLQTGDFVSFHREATAVVPLVLANNFALADVSGQQLVNTLLPYGAPLPRYANSKTQAKVFETGNPVITDIIMGQVLRKPAIAINVPVLRDGQVIYTLSAGVFLPRLAELLIRQHLPPNWIAAIFDTSGAIVARTHDSERLVGEKGSPELLAAMMQSRSGTLETRSLEGIPVFSVFSRSELSGWTVAIGIPNAELSRDLNKLLLFGGAGALGLLLAGLALAAYQARQIADAVQALIPPAVALGRGELPDTPRLDVREADDVVRALRRAHRVLRSQIVERDRAERQKEEHAQMVRSTLDDFIANMSHELRTPLTSIAGSLALLVGGVSGRLPDSAARLISIAHGNALRLVRVINDIIDIGKIESGKMTFDFKRIDLLATARQVIDANCAFAEKHGTVLRLDGESTNCLVRADADRLNQIFTNLLTNAIKFSPEGAEVIVTIQGGERMGCLMVRDHGSGIPEEFKPRIFEKFAQAETGNARQKGGTGLGLSIVASIAEQHGGTVGFRDAPGGGTIFCVEVPLWTRETATALAAA
jgi:signal transduction histidine kinase